MAKELPLTGGHVALVDDEDYERLKKFKWCAVKHKGYGDGGRYIARTSIKKEDGTWTSTSLHRLIVNPPNGVEVDHIDHDTLNCQRSNLRTATRAQNAQNRKIFKNNRCGFKGVYKDKNRERFRAVIIKNGKRFHLGWYKTASEAGKAYDEAAKTLHGEFAVTNES